MSAQDMDKAVEVIVELCKVWADSRSQFHNQFQSLETGYWERATIADDSVTVMIRDR